jgi:hypothetical protein
MVTAITCYVCSTANRNQQILVSYDDPATKLDDYDLGISSNQSPSWNYPQI